MDPFAQTRIADRPAHRPVLASGTLLLVEDSRVAADAIRLLFAGLRGRLRRADSIAQAQRHLALYRPDAVLIDLGLPDGSGLDLIAEMARARDRIARIVAMSGDPALADAACRAGADIFLEKPLRSRMDLLGALSPVFDFGIPQQIVAPLPARSAALRDDLTLALDLLNGPDRPGRREFALQFLRGVALQAGDGDMLAQITSRTAPAPAIAAMVQDRLRAQGLL